MLKRITSNWHYLLFFPLLGLFSGCTNGQKSASEVEKPGYYQTMNYGPVIAESIRLDWPENSLVRKGLAIRLDHNSALIFDTDLIRFAAGSTGGWVDISETDYTGYKGSGIAKIEGRQIFASSEIAGWAKEGSFYGPREDGMGNLPRDWAHYKGYYRYGDKVVLSYSVGDTDVLELPGAVKQGESIAFVRTLQVAGSDKPMKALILEKRASWSVTQSTGHTVIFDTGEGALGVLLANAPGNVHLTEGEGGRIELDVPSSENSRLIKILIFEMTNTEDNLIHEFSKLAADTDIPDLEDMTQGSDPQWDREILTKGVLGSENSGYVIDRIPLPADNPWGSWMRLSGLDFFKDGTRAVVTTWNGDVWIVSGIDESLDSVRWRRFASGLFYPMGVAVVNGRIFVTERSQLTRLHDLNGDGEADYYENYNNDGIIYPMANTLGLEVDSEGYFYFFKNGNRVPEEIPQHGALMRVSPDGATREVYTRGFRSANTLGIGPDDTILTADQEGNWVPVDRIDVMEQGGFYGDRRHGGDSLRVGEFRAPVVWTPKSVNNSSGMMAYAGDDRWGPLSGRWILGSYGQGTLFAILTEEIGGRLQGGIVELPVRSRSGVVRGRMNPADGQLYMVGLRGWQTLATDDGSFERVRYAGGRVHLPDELHVTPRGIEIGFTDALDPASAGDAGSYNVERWEYIYSERYGSPDMSLERPGEEGRDSVEVSSVSLSDDRKKVFLEIPDMRPVMQMKVAYELTFENGYESTNTIYHTVNWLSEEAAEERPEWQQQIISEWTNSAEATDAEDEIVFEGGSVPEWYKRGATLFESNCASCHVDGGVAPRLSESEWAAGPEEALLRIVLNGKRGERGVMTPFSWMADGELASILSYIRRQWHDREEISPSQVEKIRKITEGRTDLWTEEELKKFF